MTLTYSLGGHAYDYATWLQSNGGTYHYLGNVPAYYKMEDTWQKTGDNAKLPQFAYGNANKASSLVDVYRSFTCKEYDLGFTSPQSWSSKAGISKLRADVSGNNPIDLEEKDLTLIRKFLLTDCVHSKLRLSGLLHLVLKSVLIK
ncbi:hypothetical protein NXY42_21155 [Bacteroides fragilis]|nr:hypothetical protein [Bacteroides fragilis]